MPHLQGIGIENFRIFNKKIWFDFAPITLLVGPNNSGKSSLNKILLLLRQNNFGKLDLNKEIHSLGDFTSLLSWSEKNNKITITLPVEFKEINTNLNINLTYIQENRNEGGALNHFSVTESKSNKVIFDSSIELNFHLLYKFLKKFITFLNTNSESLDSLSITKSSLLKKFWSRNHDLRSLKINDAIFGPEILKEFRSYNFDETIFANDNLKFEEELDFLKQKFKIDGTLYFQFPENILDYDDPAIHLNCPKKYFQDLFNFFQIFNEDGFIEESIHFKSQYEKLKNNQETFNDSFLQQRILGKISANNNTAIFYTFCLDYIYGGIERAINEYERMFNYYVKYLPSYIGGQKRVFTSRGDQSVLDNLFYEFSGDNHDTLIFTDDDFSASTTTRDFINKWFQEFEIGEKFEIVRKEGTISIPYVIRDNKQVNLSDFGYGISKLVSIILFVALRSEKHVPPNMNYLIRPSIMILEEPESNLHPDFQSKLADFFVDASELFKIQFIIETHSEYLIRKFQYLIAKEWLKKEQIVLYYFGAKNKNDKENQPVKKINILSDGSLSDDFGPGFYDEADNLAIDLFNLKKHQKN